MSKILRDLESIQREVGAWSHVQFGHQPAINPLLGVVEEVGELAHAVLKMRQKIRTSEDHVAGERDAIGDIMIYLMDYCWRRQINLLEVVNETWDTVGQRDWRADPAGGVLPATGITNIDEHGRASDRYSDGSDGHGVGDVHVDGTTNGLFRGPVQGGDK